MAEAEALELAAKLAAGGAVKLALEGGESVDITQAHVKIEKATKTVAGRSITPGVIEPSFGIGRILYCLLEHSFYWREEDDQRMVLRLTPLVAPIKATVFPLQNDERFQSRVQRIATELTAAGIYNKVDTTGASIGKRYARTDEIGVPFAVTVDHKTLEDDTVTLRERDSTAQARKGPAPARLQAWRKR